ncbi:MAG: hypothetical protein HC845_05640 [Akkermansiaceae bacterium]|nr:hypothetical protein [Akkermansiaceae bacterium]
MESKQSQEFNERLSQWVSSQGLWFQIRYSLSGSGGAGKAFFHLLWVSFRLLVLLLIILAGIGLYLLKRTTTADFNRNLNASLKSGMSATELEAIGPKKEGGYLTLSHVLALGDGNTFFNSLEAKNVRCKMGLFDEFVGKWDTENLLISRFQMELRPGADDEKASKRMGDVIFRQSEKVTINSLEIHDASIFWGYSAKTRGAIKNSHLVARRLGDTWRLDFKGGTLTQNWLKNLEIEHLEITCNREGMIFEKALLRKGEGKVDFSGLKLVGGALPKIEGIAKVRLLDLENILHPSQNELVEGRISGDFKVAGSTNSSEGVGFSGKVILNSDEESLSKSEDLLGRNAFIILDDDHVPVLKALSVVDSVRDYRRTSFVEGSFELKTLNSELHVSEIQLNSDLEMTDDKVKVGHMMQINGALHVRFATQEEILEAEETAKYTRLEGEKKREEPALTPVTKKDSSSGTSGNENPITSAPKLKNFSGKETLMTRVTKSFDSIYGDWDQADRSISNLRYVGSLEISLLPNAFDQAEALKAKYPVNPSNGRIPIKVEFSDSLGNLTSSQADEIYREGQRKN